MYGRCLTRTVGRAVLGSSRRGRPLVQTMMLEDCVGRAWGVQPPQQEQQVCVCVGIWLLVYRAHYLCLCRAEYGIRKILGWKGSQWSVALLRQLVDVLGVCEHRKHLCITCKCGQYSTLRGMTGVWHVGVCSWVACGRQHALTVRKMLNRT